MNNNAKHNPYEAPRSRQELEPRNASNEEEDFGPVAKFIVTVIQIFWPGAVAVFVGFIVGMFLPVAGVVSGLVLHVIASHGASSALSRVYYNCPNSLEENTSVRFLNLLCMPLILGPMIFVALMLCLRFQI